MNAAKSGRWEVIHRPGHGEIRFEVRAPFLAERRVELPGFRPQSRESVQRLAQRQVSKGLPLVTTFQFVEAR